MARSDRLNDRMIDHMELCWLVVCALCKQARTYEASDDPVGDEVRVAEDGWWFQWSPLKEVAGHVVYGHYRILCSDCVSNGVVMGYGRPADA